MSGKQRRPPEPIAQTARKLAQQLSQTLRDADPGRERAYREREEQRQAELTKALAAHLAKKNKRRA